MTTRKTAQRKRKKPAGGRPPQRHPFYRGMARLIGLPKARDHFFMGRPDCPAGLCAELSRLVYADDPDYLRRTLRGLGFTRITEFEVDGADALIFEDRKNTYLIFRGTESRDTRDIVRDLKAWPVQWRGKGRVHSGFAGGIDGLWPQVSTEMKRRKKPLIIAGHSLGGAYATLASVLLPRHEATYTFGAPRVGCESFTRHLDGNRLFRFVCCSDIVSRLPPKGAFPYRHGGTLRYIDRFGTVHRSISDRDIIADQARAQLDYLRSYRKPLTHTPSRMLADHAPINYTTSILGLRKQPKTGSSRIPMDRRRLLDASKLTPQAPSSDLPTP